MSSSHDITLTPQEQALIMRLKSFRVPEMAHILEEQLKDPNADLNTFMERMTAMIDAEWQARADKRFNRLMKEAHLRYPAADLDETIYRPERQLDTQTIERLSTCHWIEEGKNLIVTGSSASGKTYLINAFCVTAMKQSKSVKYIKANTLMSEMEQARIKSTNLDYLNRLTKLDLLVIDDFGLMDLDLDKCHFPAACRSRTIFSVSFICSTSTILNHAPGFFSHHGIVVSASIIKIQKGVFLLLPCR